MPHSGGGGSSGGGSRSHSGGSHHSSSSSGSSRAIRHRTYFAGSHHHVYSYRGKQVSYYSREPLPRTKPKPPIAEIVMAVLFGLFFLFGAVTSSLITLVPSYPRLPSECKYAVEYIDDYSEVPYFTPEEEENIREDLRMFAEATNIPVCFEMIDDRDWDGFYASLEKYAYQSYVSRWTDEDHFLIVLSLNQEEIQEEGQSYVNLWGFETMVGDNLTGLDDRQCAVFNNAFTDNLYRLSADYTIEQALREALDELVVSLHTIQKTEPVQVVIFLLVLLFMVGIELRILYLPLKRYKEKKAEFEYYEKHGFPETREEMLARYTRAQHVFSTCPNCGAPNDKNLEVCEYCDSNLLIKEQ